MRPEQILKMGHPSEVLAAFCKCGHPRWMHGNETMLDDHNRDACDVTVITGRTHTMSSMFQHCPCIAFRQEGTDDPKPVAAQAKTKES